MEANADKASATFNRLIQLARCHGGVGQRLLTSDVEYAFLPTTDEVPYALSTVHGIYYEDLDTQGSLTALMLKLKSKIGRLNIDRSLS